MSESKSTVVLPYGNNLPKIVHQLMLPKAYPQSQSSQEDVQEKFILSRNNQHRKPLLLQGLKIDRGEQDIIANVTNNGYSYSMSTRRTPKGAALDINVYVFYYVVNERTIVGRYNDIESALRHLSMFGNNVRNHFTKRSRRALIPVFYDAPSHPYSLLSNGFISQFLHKKNNASSRVKQTITNADQVRKAILGSLSCCYWETETELEMMTRVVENEHKILFPAIRSTSMRRSGLESTVQDVIIDLPSSNKGRKERIRGQRFREALRRKTLQVYQEAHVLNRAMNGRGNLHIISDSEDE